MEKNQAVQNQKVFVRLEGVIEFQTEVTRTEGLVPESDHSKTYTKARIEAYKWVARKLELPIVFKS